MTLKRDPNVGELLYDIPEVRGHFATYWSNADRVLRGVAGGWFGMIVKYARDPFVRPDAYKTAREQGKGDVEASIQKARRALHDYRAEYRPDLIEMIEKKRVLSPWVLDANSRVYDWLMKRGEERYGIILAAKAALEANRDDKDAWECVRALAEAPGLLRAEVLGPVISHESIQRAHWRGLAPDTLEEMDQNDAAAEVLEENIGRTEGWFGKVMIAGETQLLELDQLRTNAAGATEAVASYLERREGNWGGN